MRENVVGENPQLELRADLGPARDRFFNAQVRITRPAWPAMPVGRFCSSGLPASRAANVSERFGSATDVRFRVSPQGCSPLVNPLYFACIIKQPSSPRS